MAQTFLYKARNPAGKLVSGKVEAESRNSAVALLRERKFFVVELKEASAGSFSFKSEIFFRKKVGARDLAILCRQFATMVQAGLPILQCLNILIQQSDNITLKETLKKVAGNLEKGLSLAESIRNFPGVFPQIFISMVEAGEIGGSLDNVLERLAFNFEKEHDIKEKVKSAMTYPAVVILVAVVVMAALLIFVIPSFVAMLNDMKAPIPAPTQIVINTSNFLKSFWYIAILSIAGAMFGYKQAVKKGQGKNMMDRLMLKLPVFGPMINKIIISRFCRSLSTLLMSGVPVLQSLDVVKNIVGNTVIIKSIKETQNSIKEGQNISLPLQKSGVFPPMVTRMMAIGEETGSLDTLLERIADFYEQEVDELVSRLSSMLEPILIVVMGGIVGFIILSIMLPMYSIVTNVKR